MPGSPPSKQGAGSGLSYPPAPYLLATSRALGAPPPAEPGAADVAQRAQHMLEHSLLGELRTVVARALSGLDMFAEPHLKELVGSPTRVSVAVYSLSTISGWS